MRERIIERWKAEDSRFSASDTAFWEGIAPYWLQSDSPGEEKGKRAAAFADYLRSRGLLWGDQTVLDIGCGKGQIAAEFAKTAGHVTGLDLSPLMCEAAKSLAAARGLDNTDFIVGDFCSFRPEEAGLKEQYDLVSACLVPEAETYEGFRRLNSLSRGSCFLAMLTENGIPMFQEIAAEVIGDAAEEKPGKIFRLMMAFDLLCLEGLRPEVFFYEMRFLNRIPANALALQYFDRIWPRHAFTGEERKTILRMLRDRADQDGILTVEMNTVIGCLFWNVGQGQRQREVQGGKKHE